MKIRVQDIHESERALTFPQEMGEINETLATSKSPVEFQFRRPVDVSVTYYRSGTELFFGGHISGTVSGVCGRCLESFAFGLGHDFGFVLKPGSERLDDELAADEDSLYVYEGDEIDLSGFVREEVLLSLPTRPLCKDSCSGLCPSCGTNLNAGSCQCRTEWVDPRFEVLRELKARFR